MGTVSSTSTAGTSGNGKEVDRQPIIKDEDDSERWSFSRRHSSGDTVNCPTCQGTGRMPRDQENMLVAVIPCTDQRLKPRHTKLYVFVSITLCLLISGLMLFFLFPRSIILSPATVKSSYVYFTKDGVLINITNVLNVTNNNFAGVQAYNLSVQALDYDIVVGTISIKNVTSVKPRSIVTYSFVIPVLLNNETSTYCEKASLPVHILYLHLQMSMTVYYLAHYEQLSMEAYEYIDCGSNSTIPHSVQPST
ncbi:transmembrane protein 106B-like [Sphaeramia orbicularis]|uniref:Transmembrane protein 106B-like n=1 Tax=Sphaeramia orbicularis TaxID=375764 RepID=A0A672YN18_9TELE|nr:transmembrane protein 106B-like [Sphaeramia orbicularis]